MPISIILQGVYRLPRHILIAQHDCKSVIYFNLLILLSVAQEANYILQCAENENSWLVPTVPKIVLYSGSLSIPMHSNMLFICFRGKKEAKHTNRDQRCWKGENWTMKISTEILRNIIQSLKHTGILFTVSWHWFIGYFASMFYALPFAYTCARFSYVFRTVPRVEFY